MNHTILTGSGRLSLAATGKPKPWSWGEKISGQGDCILQSCGSGRDCQKSATSISVLGSLWSDTLGSEGKGGSGITTVEVILEHCIQVGGLDWTLKEIRNKKKAS